MQLLLIDDDPDLTGMLAEYLEGEGFSVEAVGTAAQGREAALSGRYDAVILDVMLAGESGIDLLRTLRRESDVPVVMLTAKGSDVERVVGLEVGADDYVTKPYFAPELVARLRAVLRRPRRSSAHVEGRLSAGLLALDAGRREATWADEPIELTATEFNLLDALLRAGGRVATKDDLSVRLLGRQRQSYDRSLDVHASNLRQKLERISGGTVHLTTIRGVGWRIEQ